jgi:hypothetical protein
MAKQELPLFHFNSFCLTHQYVLPQNFILDVDEIFWIIGWGMPVNTHKYSSRRDWKEAQDVQFEDLLIPLLSNDLESLTHMKAVAHSSNGVVHELY